MFDAFRDWLKGRSKDATTARDPLSPGAIPSATSPADNQRLARFHLWLRDEIERLSTAPGVAEHIRALFNRVFPDRPELATRVAAKALLAEQTGARRNYSYAFDLDGEIVAVSVSVSCQTVAAFLHDVRTGAYLKYVADAAALLADRGAAAGHAREQMTAVVALELLIDLEAQAAGAAKFVHSYLTAMPTALLSGFGEGVSKHAELRRPLYEPQLLTADEIAVLLNSVRPPPPPH